MAELLGRPPPAPNGEGRGDSSEAAAINRPQLPRLVAPTPIHPGRISPSSAGLDMSTKAASPKVEERTSTPQTILSLRAQTDVNAVLPVQGEEEDAQAAIDKLDRMQKALQSRRKLLKGTGAEGMAKLATAGGKRAYGKPLKKETKVQDDAESVKSLPRFGEVKLGISSLPGYPIMAAQKARQYLRRSSMKPQEDEKSAGEESASHWSMPSRKPRSLRLLQQREPSPAPSSVLEKDATQQKVPTKLSIVTNGTANPAAQHKPELTSVREVVAEEPPVKPTIVEPEIDDTDESNAESLKNLRGPRLMIQSPSDNGLQPLPEGVPLQPEISSSPKLSSASSGSGVEENDVCDERAQEAAEACQDHIANPEIFSPGEEGTFHDSPSSASSSENEGNSYTSDSEGSLTPTTPQEELMLNLEHGEELTIKQKRRLLRKVRKSASGEDREQDRSKLTVRKRPMRRQGTLSNRVHSGLNYASSQSRNRRAMERYSPHPSRPSSTAPQNSIVGQARRESAGNLADVFGSSRQSLSGLGPAITGDMSRSSTPVLLSNMPGSGLDSRRSSMSEREGGANQIADGSFCMSPIVDEHVDRDDRWGELTKSFRRQGTNHSLTSSIPASASFRKRYFSLRRKRQDTVDLEEENDSGANTPRADPEQELDTMLRKLAAEQAPDQIEEQYEYDVLYENQRGLMFFGIPKFSAKTLFQWDPSPWTNSYHEDSAYNVVNAQLPNPYWEWVHPEWMIDMTGDVDESGWQYSHNFGRLFLPMFPTRPDHQVPPSGIKGNAIMNKKMIEMNEKREEKNKTRSDEGLEALKRTARTRNAKWTGIPDQNKYVRRRRWIRLRRRKALQRIVPISSTPNAGTPLGMGKASGDWSQMVKDEGKRLEQERRLVTSPIEQSSSSSSDGDSISDLESDRSGSEYASQGAGSSGFLPRRTPGRMDEGALDNRSAREQERMRRHAKEFTGTIRELKSLLPAILDRKQSIRPSNRQRLEAELWMSEVDARNPFISWNLVKKRLDDDDLAFASTSLRARERRHAQRILERRPSQSAGADETNIDSTRYELTKDAIVEINYRRVMRVMKACKVDRHKLQLWKIWLGVEPVSSITEVAREEDLTTAGVGGSRIGQERQDALRQARARWRKAFSHPDVMDVWDLLERRLDRLLLTFEYQGSRASLLRLLLTLHATSHWAHRFRPTQTTLETDTNQIVEVNVPSTISPQSSSRNLWDFAASSGSTHIVDEWRGVGLPRLEFWSDLEQCARTLLDNSSTKEGAPSSSILPGRSSPRQNLGRNSPAPSIVRSSTPQTIGSLANGPSIRRLTTPHPPSPLQKPHASKSYSPATSTSRHTNTNNSDIDQSFLADLLQLPAQSRQEMLAKTASEQPPSSIIRRFTRAAEEDQHLDEEDGTAS